MVNVKGGVFLEFRMEVLRCRKERERRVIEGGFRYFNICL